MMIEGTRGTEPQEHDSSHKNLKSAAYLFNVTLSRLRDVLVPEKPVFAGG